MACYALTGPGGVAIVDPLLPEPGPVHPYEPSTWGPAEADALPVRVGGWDVPGPPLCE